MNDLISKQNEIKRLHQGLLADIRALIESARQNVAQTVNVEKTILYWQVGKRIRKDILKEERAEYGKAIVSTLSNKLAVEYGNGFSRPNLSRMIQFVELCSSADFPPPFD